MVTKLDVLRRAAVVGVLGIAVTHLFEVGDKFKEVPYQGVLFVALIAACLVLALLSRAIAPRVWWTSVLAVGVLPFVAFIVSRTVGLPGGEDDIGAWGEWSGIASLVFEAGSALLAMRALQVLTTAAGALRAPARRRQASRPARVGQAIRDF
ncbi:MAG: hypothetical protein ACXVRH_05225 [Thermoleophilaceae bacterium]